MEEREGEKQWDRSERVKERKRGTQIAMSRPPGVLAFPSFNPDRRTYALFSLSLSLSLSLSPSFSLSLSLRLAIVAIINQKNTKNSSSSPSWTKPRQRSLRLLLLPPPITRAPSRSRPPTGPRPRSFPEGPPCRGCSCRTPRASSTTSRSDGTTRRDTRCKILEAFRKLKRRQSTEGGGGGATSESATEFSRVPFFPLLSLPCHLFLT